MSLDNSLGGDLSLKKTEVDPLLFKRCRGSGETMLSNIDNQTSHKSPKSSPPTVPSHQSHTFPPPSLADVPVEYIMDQLHNLAPHYWDKPDTADCTIIVPVPHASGRLMHPSVASRFPPESLLTLETAHDPSALGRRATEPSLHAVPQMSFKFHMDYLSAHSTYLRGLLSGSSPLDLINSSSRVRSSSASGGAPIPANRLPRLLPSPPSHPVLYLPVPDPSSFHLLVHWMYFGRTNFIADCLHQGIIHWEGVARNVEYLGLPATIKVFLSRWYSRWLDPDQPLDDYEDDSDEEDDGNESSDTAYSEESDGDVDSSSTVTDEEEEKFFDEEEPPRGRTRAKRPLSCSSEPRTQSN